MAVNVKEAYESLRPEQQGMIYSSVVLITELIRSTFAGEVANQQRMENSRSGRTERTTAAAGGARE
jgi:hypothetical protein